MKVNMACIDNAAVDLIKLAHIDGGLKIGNERS